MKHILFKIALLCCLVFVLDRALGWGLDKLYLRDPRNSLWQAAAERSPIVFLGSSRDKHAIVPKIIEEKTGLSVYNAAYDGAGMAYMRAGGAFLLSHYLPKIMVISVIHLDQERADIRKFAPYLDEPAVRPLLADYTWQIRLKYAWLKTPRYNSMLFKLIKRSFEARDLKAGYESFYGKAPETIPDAGAFAGAGGELKQGEQLLKDLVADARRRGVLPVLLELPTGREKSSLSYFTYRDLAKTQGIPFLDFSKGGRENFELSPDCFYEEGHLNDKGAREFSAVLGNRLAHLLSGIRAGDFSPHHKAAS